MAEHHNPNNHNNHKAGDNSSDGVPMGIRGDQRGAVATPIDHDAAIYRAMRRSAARQRPEYVTIDAETLGRVRAALRTFRNMLDIQIGAGVAGDAYALMNGVDDLLADITAEVGRG